MCMVKESSSSERRQVTLKRVARVSIFVVRLAQGVGAKTQKVRGGSWLQQLHMCCVMDATGDGMGTGISPLLHARKQAPAPLEFSAALVFVRRGYMKLTFSLFISPCTPLCTWLVCCWRVEYLLSGKLNFMHLLATMQLSLCPSRALSIVRRFN